jgi:hypothetical protein
MGMMTYVLDLLYWSVIIENKFKRTRLASVHVCYDCVCTTVQDLGFFNN